jgi:hypothetical protein
MADGEYGTVLMPITPIFFASSAASKDDSAEVIKDGEYWRGVMHVTRAELQGLADTWSSVLAEKKAEIPEEGM